jgi:hypothetical protein
VLSVGVAFFAGSAGFDRDRAFYPTVLIVIASYYVLFAAMGDSVQTVLVESVVMMGFVIAAAAGFKSSVWIVVGALAGHGVFDALHGKVLEMQACLFGGRPFVSPSISARQPALPGSSNEGSPRTTLAGIGKILIPRSEARSTSLLNQQG